MMTILLNSIKCVQEPKEKQAKDNLNFSLDAFICPLVRFEKAIFSHFILSFVGLTHIYPIFSNTLNEVQNKLIFKWSHVFLLN